MAWYNESWLYRKKISIDQTNIDADLTNFPAFVSLADTAIIANAKPNLDDVLFTSSDEITKLSHELVKDSFFSTGAWCWFSNPRAVYANGITFTGGIRDNGDIFVSQYNDSTGAFVETTLAAALESDDHDNPSFLVRSDGRLVAFYGKHDADQLLRYKISTNPYDSTSWGTEQNVTYDNLVSYSNPVSIADDSNACYVFCRVRNGTTGRGWDYRRTTDFSAWGGQVTFWDCGDYQQYLQCIQNGPNRVDFLCSDRHPDNNTGGSSLYHFYAEWSGGALKFYNSFGVEQTLPLDGTKATLIHDGATDDGWNWQIMPDSSGFPRVLYQKRVSTTGAGDNRLMFRRWTGSAWSSAVEITALGGYVYAGEISYTGGACFDGSDINKVYLGKQVSGVYELQEWSTSDNGATWSKTSDITSGSTAGYVNIRPFSPRGHNGKIAVLYSGGAYASYTSYSNILFCYPQRVVGANVKIPSISGSVNTDIYCYYGNSAAANQENAVDVFTNGYLAAWNMRTAPGTKRIRNAVSGTVYADKNFTKNPFTVGGNLFFNANVDDFLNVSGLNTGGLSQFTIEALINNNGAGAAGVNHQIFSSWIGATTKTMSCVMFRVKSTASGNVLEGYAIKETDTQIGGGFGISLTPNQIEHVAYVYDTTNLRGYVNGAAGGTTYASGSAMDAGASGATYIGNTSHDTISPFGGFIYNVRVSNVARSEAWLKASSVNLKTPSNFYSVGAVESAVATLTGNNSIQSNSSSTGSITTAAGTKSVSTTLVNVSGTPLSNLTGLKWAFFDQSNVSSLSTPVATGSSGSTDANGLFAVNVTTSLPVGSAGWLIITNSDGNPATNHKCYAGPAVVN